MSILNKTSPGEIIFGAIVFLTVAVFANSYFDLGIGVLYEIEDAITGGDGGFYQEDFSIDYDTASENCKALIKVFGENKRVMRKHARDARDAGREEEAEGIEQRIEEMTIQIKNECG